MKKYDIAIGDTVVLKGKQGIVEAFHKDSAVVYIIEDQERHLATLKTLRHCMNKYDEMVKSTGD